MSAYEVAEYGAGFVVCGMPGPEIVSRYFATRGEAEAELARIEARLANHADHMAYKRDELRKEGWRHGRY